MTNPPPSQQQKAETFRALHENEAPFLIPNPWDLGSAKILQNIGFKALATTSSGLGWSLGERDGEATQDTILKHCAELAAGTRLPITADLGIGFGVEPEAVAKTISHAAEAGLVGCSIEDASVLDGKLMDRSLAVERIEAAVETIKSLKHDFILTARTEGFVHGAGDFDESLARLSAFENAGADVLYAPGIVRFDLIQNLCASVEKPVNVLTGFTGMNASFDQLVEAGVQRVSVGNQLAKISYGALIRSAEELLTSNSIIETDNNVRSSTIGKLIGRRGV